MLRTRGGGRFEGYGNVKVASDRGHRSGWQLTCAECKELSEVLHRSGSTYPPKVLIKMFSQMGWKVGNTAEADVCPACLEKRRERHREERKQYAKGNVDRLLDMIRQIDLMLASNVTIDYGPYQPQIAAQLKSLFETAYLCGMLPTSDVSNLDTSPPPKPLPSEKDWWSEAVDQLEQPPPESVPERIPDPPPPPEPPPPSSPPPAQEERRMSSRTAAFLAEVRKQVFKNGAAA